MSVSDGKFFKLPGLLCFLVTILLATFVYASPTVTVISPGSGSFNGAPVFYEAYATSPSCSKGVSSMRIYTAPGVSAFTVNGGHVEAFINLKPGTYNTVVQAWDHCGGVGKVAVGLQVVSNAGVTVFMPNGPAGTSPLHIAASSQNSACAAGINAMRIYTAPGVGPYTINSNQLDAYINLLPGTYNLTVQAWDNCGHVYKFQFSQPVGPANDAYLYVVDHDIGTVSLFRTNNGVLVNPNGSGNPPMFTAGPNANAIATDPGGWFVYALTTNGVAGYQINQSNGTLAPIQGSPFPLTGSGPADIAMDPRGNFLYAVYSGSNTVSSYRINRSSGALSSAGSARGSGGLFAVTPDGTGQFVYAIDQNFNGVHVFGYKANPNTGALNAVPGSPHALNSFDNNGTSLASVGRYLYVEAGSNDLYGFSINSSSGALTSVPGSPYYVDGPIFDAQDLLADRFERYVWSGDGALNTTTPQGWFSWYDINKNTGALNSTNIHDTTGGNIYPALVESYSGNYVYSGGNDYTNTGSTNVVSSWKIASDGSLVQLSGPLNPGGVPWGVAVARQFAN